MSAKYTPEPWAVHRSPVEGWGEDDFVVSGDSEPGDINIIIHSGIERPRVVADWQRACLCVNSLAGIESPAEALDAARNALRLAEEAMTDGGDVEPLPYVPAIEACRRAIALLSPDNTKK